MDVINKIACAIQITIVPKEEKEIEEKTETKLQSFIELI